MALKGSDFSHHPLRLSHGEHRDIIFQKNLEVLILLKHHAIH
jgi:hypothetical protein